MLRVEPEVQNYLAGQPEYRMGIQKVVARLNTGNTEEGFVVNSEVFVQGNEVPSQMLMGWNDLVVEAAKSSLAVQSIGKLISREPETLHGVRQIALDNEKYAQLLKRVGPKRKPFC